MFYGGGGQKNTVVSQKVKLIILAVLIVSLGFIRDYFFININWIYLNLTIGRPNQALDEFHFLLNWTPAEIDLLKWILTFVFLSLFALLTLLINHIAFRNRSYNKITVITFFGITLVALIIYAFGMMTNTGQQLYGIVRTLMGIVQSFMPAMFLFVLFKFLPEKNKN